MISIINIIPTQCLFPQATWPYSRDKVVSISPILLRVSVIAGRNTIRTSKFTVFGSTLLSCYLVRPCLFLYYILDLLTFMYNTKCDSFPSLLEKK